MASKVKAADKGKPATLSRSAKTGRVVSKAEAAANPDTTVTEKVSRKKKKQAEFKIPKKMGEVADLLYTTRADRLDVNKKVDELKSYETKLKNYIIDNLPKSSATGASGKVANVRVVPDSVFQAEDWEKVYAWIKKTGNFQILNRALNQTAIGEIYEEGGKKFNGIPGIVSQGITKVSVTKLSSK